MLKALAVWLMIVVVVSQTGCMRVPRVGPEEPDGGVPLVAFTDAPTTVPTVSVAGSPLKAAQSEWFVDGAWERNLVIDPSAVPISEVPRDRGGITFSVGSAVPPQLVVASVYTKFDDAGLPDLGSGEDRDCVGGEGCSVSTQEAQTVVRLNDAPIGSVIVLRIAYLKAVDPAEPSENLLSVTASWAVTPKS